MENVVRRCEDDGRLDAILSSAVGSEIKRVSRGGRCVDVYENVKFGLG